MEHGKRKAQKSLNSTAKLLKKRLSIPPTHIIDVTFS